MNQQILASKFFPPVIHRKSIIRPRLFDILTKGLKENHKLALISAPAGYGKSTLVADWLDYISHDKGTLTNNQSAPPYAWLSLDSFDNDPSRFFMHWLACFRKFNNSIGQRFENLLSIPQFPSTNILMDELLLDLTNLESNIIIVLDDFNVIHNSFIHDCLNYFLEHQPASIHQVIITRSDPPISISRMRTRSELTELRARDIKFTVPETIQFFDQTMELALSDQTIIGLEKKTEGWPAGLQLAGLALKNNPEPEKFVETFRGSHRYVLDYLAEEVVRQLPVNLQVFLSLTSILDKFNATICEKITGMDDCSEVLQQLEKSNLFLTPLDDEGVWYRYHHLFADYLRTGLGKKEAGELNKKASLWFEENGLPFEAIRHAFETDDTTFTAELLERLLQKGYTWSEGNLSLLLQWLDELPKAILYARPLLCLLAVPVVCAAVRFDQAEQLLLQTELALTGRDDLSHLYAYVVFYRGGIELMRGDIKKAIELTQESLLLLPKDDFLFQARATSNLGQAFELSGQTEDAIKYYLKASELGFAAEATYLAVSAKCSLAYVLRSQGKLQLAMETVNQVIEVIKEKHTYPLGMAYIILGILHFDHSELDQAEILLQQGIDLTRKGGLIDEMNWGIVFLAYVKCHLGQKEDAISLMNQAFVMIHSYHIPRITFLASAFQAQLHLLTNQNQLAYSWANDYLRTRDSEPVKYLRVTEDLILVKILLALGKYELILVLLEPLIHFSKIDLRNKDLIEGLILLASYQWKHNKKDLASEAIETAILLGAPEGMIQIFKEHEEIFDLLAKHRNVAPAFVDKILMINESNFNGWQALSKLPEPLSDQEQKVFSLILQGKTNQEISEELFISIGTAKWHVHNIFQKLGVNNRMHAIALAREWGINP